MPVDIAIVQGALNTSTGTQNFTKSGFGTPKAVMVFATYATSNATNTAQGGMVFAAASGTGNQFATFNSSENNQTSSDEHRDNDPTLINFHAPGTGTVAGLAPLNAFITDGFQLNITNAPPSAYLMKAVLLGGSDLQAYVGSVALGNSGPTNSISVTAPGFTPDVIIGFHRLTNTAGTSASKWSWGFCRNNGGTPVQQCISGNGDDNVNPANYNGQLRLNSIGIESFSSSVGRRVEVTSFTANGFDLLITDAAANAVWNYLALKFDNGLQHYVGTYTSPTGTGDHSNTSVGFKPQFIFHLLSGFTATDTQNAAGEAGSVGVALATASDQCCLANNMQDNVSPTVCQSLVDDSKHVNINAHSGGVLAVATRSAFLSNGYTLNYTTAPGTAVLWPVLALGENPAGRRRSRAGVI